jgi:hypothetical protein
VPRLGIDPGREIRPGRRVRKPAEVPEILRTAGVDLLENEVERAAGRCDPRRVARAGFPAAYNWLDDGAAPESGS